MRKFSESSRSINNDENHSGISSRLKDSLSSRLQQPYTALSSTTASSSRNLVQKARIGLNERAVLHSLDPSINHLGLARSKKFQVYADENENLRSKAVDNYNVTNRKPLAERLVQENYITEDDYKLNNDNYGDDDNMATLEDVAEFINDEDDEDELDEDEDEDVEDDEDEDEDDDDDLYLPMSPKWNTKVYKELQRVTAKFARDTLDEDDEDTTDISMVAEYAPEIFRYMHELEIRLSLNARYMDHQDELEWSMRNTLVGWLVQVHQRFNLLPETLFLTINFMDRFLSKRKVSLSRFQLVGAVALFIAAKYEEINCPSIQEIAYMVDHAYSVEDLLKAEKFMIGILEFEMGWPGPMSFLRRTSKADDYDFETRTLAKYFLEITIMDSRFVASPPSWLAAGAHYLSRRLLSKGPWTEAHVFYSGYTEDQLRPLADVLINLCQDPQKNHNAIYEKYQERRYRRSATFVQEWISTVQNRS